MTNGFLWLKVVHIVAMVAWMAGMLYLPRLFVYHAAVPAGSDQARTFVMMEARLMRFIMLPALLVTWASGLALAAYGGFLGEGWLHGKLLLVIVLTVIHGFFARFRKDFARAANRRSAAFFRGINELPTLVLIGIVILVILKPFSSY
jgi:putative membrane protein